METLCVQHHSLFLKKVTANYMNWQIIVVSYDIVDSN